MLLGLVREGEGVAAQVLQSLGADSPASASRSSSSCPVPGEGVSAVPGPRGSQSSDAPPARPCSISSVAT